MDDELDLDLDQIQAAHAKAVTYKRKDLEMYLRKIEDHPNPRPGDIRGYLRVLSKSGYKTKQGLVLWKCRCTCGKYVLKSKIQLTDISAAPCCGCKGLNKLVDHYKAEAKKAYINKFSSFNVIKKSVRDEFFIKYIDDGDIKSFCKRFNISTTTAMDFLEAKAKKLHTNLVLQKMTNIQSFNLDISYKVSENLQKFIDVPNLRAKIETRLSPPNSKTLTPSEEVYCQVYASTGNQKLALTESAFGDLLDPADSVRKRLLCNFLEDKPNLAVRINEIKTATDPESVSRDTIKEDLLTQISQLKATINLLPIDSNASLGNRGHLLRAVEMLGKTIGAFQENVKVDHVNSGDVLDKLIEMTKVSSEYSDVKD